MLIIYDYINICINEPHKLPRFCPKKVMEDTDCQAVVVYMAWWSLKINVAIHLGEDSIEQRPSSRQSLPG